MENPESPSFNSANAGKEWEQSSNIDTQQLGKQTLDAMGFGESAKTGEIVELLSRVPAEERGDLPSLFEAVPEDVQKKYIRAIEAGLGSKDEVAARTAIRGAAFELIRISSVMKQGLEQIDFGLEIPDTIHFLGYAKKDGFDVEPTKEYDSTIELDVPLIRDGKPYVYETKSYPRMQFGSLPKQRNQMLKYQAAINDGIVDGATVEIKGRIHSRILDWATEHVPDVEIIYSMGLPSGAEYRFALKRAENGNGLGFRNEERSGTPEEMAEDERVISGIQKAVFDGTIANILSSVDIENPSEELAPYLEDPMGIKDAGLFDEYERLRQKSIFKKLIEKSAE